MVLSVHDSSGCDCLLISSFRMQRISRATAGGERQGFWMVLLVAGGASFNPHLFSLNLSSKKWQTNTLFVALLLRFDMNKKEEHY